MTTTITIRVEDGEGRWDSTSGGRKESLSLDQSLRRERVLYILYHTLEGYLRSAGSDVSGK